MSVNHIKIRIEGQLKNQTNYVWNNARLIYVDTLKLTEFSYHQRAIIIDLKTELESLEDSWCWSGIPNRAKTENVLNNLRRLELVLQKAYL